MASADQYEKDFEAKPFKTLFKVLVILMFIGFGLGSIGFVMGWFGEAAQVAREELGPKALLRKYEWFKDAAAGLDQKQASIKVYAQRVKSMKADYEGESRKDWDRTDKEQYNQWQGEVAGVKASFNQLAAEYNSAMSKANWRFTNVGGLPAGATIPLPREFKTYSEQ